MPVKLILIVAAIAVFALLVAAKALKTTAQIVAVIIALLLVLAGFSSAALHAVGPVMVGNTSGLRLGRGMSFWMVGGELGRTLGPILIVSAIGLITIKETRWLMIGIASMCCPTNPTGVGHHQP